jgi:hypothetical protein
MRLLGIILLLFSIAMMDAGGSNSKTKENWWIPMWWTSAAPKTKPFPDPGLPLPLRLWAVWLYYWRTESAHERIRGMIKLCFLQFSQKTILCQCL